ncbi:MAG: halocyanin domain-containing protein [Haloarculaceae archaeon]
MSDRDTGRTPISRRTALRTAVGAAGGALAAGGAAPVAAQSGGLDFGGWFSNVGNFDGVVDRRGQSEVTVEVGAEGNGGNFAFGPPAVRVDPGTTVVWEWTGKGSAHNVVSQDDTFESSQLTSEAGFTFKYTFESEGIHKYYCRPHQAQGMKGAVVVGDVGTGGGQPDYGGWFSNVGNFSGTVDRTGQEEVTVKVGAQGNGGNFAFAPAAVHVDPGTTIVWEWTGKGSYHNVVSEGDDFESSELANTAGFTFEQTFQEDGIYKYYCRPHRAKGMKGAVVVGEEYPSTGGGGAVRAPRPPGSTATLALFGGTLFALLASPLAFGLFLRHRYPEGAPARPEETTAERPTVTEAAVADDRQVEALGHDEFDPTGTFSLVLVYMLILAVMWVFMYFVEFLNNGPTVIG